jgi:predicted AAA+ superfamily ATPase
LFRFLANIPSDTILDKEEIFNKFNGLLTEQFVLQQLSKYELFYWTSDKIGEVDFILQFDSNIVPIEVKSGTNLKAKSLKLFREKYSPKISVKFSLKDTKLNDDLLNIALYHSFMFDNLLKSSI